jgi:4a-hydroxytetrahydrobiopterin dehydratase
MKNWKEENNQLIREFEFADFSEALAAVVRIGILAEKHVHHPDIDIRYNRIKIALTTHDEGNTITAKDRKLAREIDGIIVN